MDAAFDDLQAMAERMVSDPDKPTSFLHGDPTWKCRWEVVEDMAKIYVIVP